jgi:hypothetical protein
MTSPVALDFQKWPASIWQSFRVVRNDNCESCSSYLWDVKCSSSGGSFSLAQVDSEEIGQLICNALDSLKEKQTKDLRLGEIITYPEDDGTHGDAG